VGRRLRLGGVIETPQSGGYRVTTSQFPLTALADDVARLRQVLDRQDGPIIVAGRSYGGQVMTALGTDARNVAGLVYVAAIGPDQDESLGGLLSQGPVTPALAAPVHRRAGLRLAVRSRLRQPLRRRRRPGQGQGDVRRAAGPGHVHIGGRGGRPAWKTLPSWYLVAADDHALPPDAERMFASRMGATTIEIPSSHVPMVSHPGDVALLIKTAAEAAWLRARPAHPLTP
jgi:hypothetical protein